MNVYDDEDDDDDDVDVSEDEDENDDDIFWLVAIVFKHIYFYACDSDPVV